MEIVIVNDDDTGRLVLPSNIPRLQEEEDEHGQGKWEGKQKGNRVRSADACH
jgi:hypothetical protein